MKLSIVIPHRGNSLGLWATIHSCDAALSCCSSYEYVIVSNGSPLDLETSACLKEVSKARSVVHLHTDEPLTPPVARQRGAEVSQGSVLAFFDNHCLVASDYFERALPQMERLHMLHSATVFYAGRTQYHYRLKLHYNFWGGAEEQPLSPDTYRLSVGGHGGFLVRRDVWDAVGGYGPESLFTGYGGEEMVFDLKMWRLGYQNWIDPQLVHYHYCGNRGYSRHFTDEYYTNLLVSALVVGGEPWMLKLLDSLTRKTHMRLAPREHYFDLALKAYDRAGVYAKQVDALSQHTLDELLKLFTTEGVAM